MHRLLRTALLGAVAVAGTPGVAAAHVTLQPDELPAGAFKRLDVRVPNERDDASTKKVQVKFPAGFIFVSYQPVPGWTTTVKLAKLAEPVQAFGEKHTEGVDSVTFKADGKGVAPGQFQDFGLSVALPDKPGSTLTFKALQTYSSGEVVRWIGTPDADQPAPRVKLTAATGSEAAAGGAVSPPTPAAASRERDGDDDGDGLALIALVVGALGLLAGVAGLMAARRARLTATA